MRFHSLDEVRDFPFSKAIWFVSLVCPGPWGTCLPGWGGG